MKIRTRLTLWYAGILILLLLVMGLSAWRAITGQASLPPRSEPPDQAREVIEVVLLASLPVLALGWLGGWWFTRRAMAPLDRLTAAVKKLEQRTLREPLPRNGSGDELDHLTEEFNALTTRLEADFNRLREFTLQAARELKTPLASLYGDTETALRDDTLSPGEYERATSQLAELRRLTRLVDGLTLLIQADAGQITLAREPVRWDELIRDSFADALILAEPRGIRVELSARETVTVAGDRHRLRQLLLILTENAVKYNRPQGQILMVLRRIGDTAEFSIANTGPGIPPGQLPRVFDRFYHGDAVPGGKVEGCGLGLSIAQWIVTAHHGTMLIESPDAELTTVRVRLQIYSPAA